jgi:hypothetical protein
VSVLDLPKDIEKYGDALIKAWEQYLKIIDILIALSGATALVMVNLFKEVGLTSLKTPYGVIAISSFALALFFLAFWRFVSQYFYEYETIGGNEIASRYFAYYGISAPVTKAFQPQMKLHAFYRAIYRCVAYGSGIVLGVTWVSFLLLVFC